MIDKLLCFLFGHVDKLIIKVLTPDFRGDKIRYKTVRYCVRCHRMED